VAEFCCVCDRLVRNSRSNPFSRLDCTNGGPPEKAAPNITNVDLSSVLKKGKTHLAKSVT
jgi:hypothetical protein